MTSRVFFIALSAFFGANGPDIAFAEDGQTLDEVVVSATRRTASTSEVSAAVGIIDAERARMEKLLTDALSSSPGVFVQQTTPGQGAAIVRGLKGSSILHLVDGTRLNNAIFRDAPTQYFALIPVSAVERIEALRGTPTSLYGSDAVGGIINVVTRVPRFDSTESQASGNIFARYGSADLERTLRGTLDVGNRNVATSVSLELLETGDRRTGSGNRIAPSGYEARGGRYVMSITPDDESAWLFDVQFLEQPDTPRIDELVAGFGQTEPSSSEFSFAPNRRIFAHARYDRKQGPLDLDWRFDLSWQRIDDDRVSRGFQSDLRRTERNRSDLSGAILTAARQHADRSWIAGLEVYHDRVTSRRRERNLISGAEQDLASRFPDGATLDHAAMFANGDLQLSARQALSGGVRLSNVRVDVPETPVSPAADFDVTDISGDVGWRYDASESWQLVANLGYGFRAPNVFDLGTFGERPGNRFNIPNTALDSEHVLHADIGARRHGDGWRLEFVLYALDYDDRITSVSTGNTTPDGRDIVQSVNASESSIHGIEVAASVSIFENITLGGVLNYARGEQELGGLKEPADRIPPLSGRIELDYDSGMALTLSAWLNFAGGQDRLSARDLRDVRIDPAGTPGWGAAGAALKWRGVDGWEFAFGVDNMLDRRYRNHGSGIDAPGRDFSLSARYSW